MKKKTRRYVIKYFTGKYLDAEECPRESEKARAKTYTHSAALRVCKARDGYADWRTNGHFRIERTNDAERPNSRDRRRREITMQTPMTEPPPEVACSAVVLPRPMREAPLDGTHILAHNGDEYFPPVVVHFFAGSWFVSK